MSEIIKEFKKGDLLYIDSDGKAQWGQPEGYPCEIKSVIEFDVDGSKDYSTPNGFTKISDTTHDDLVGSKLTVHIESGGEAIGEAVDVDGSLIGFMTMGAGFTAYTFEGNDGTVLDVPLIAVIDASNTKGYETGTFVFTFGGTANGVLTMSEKQPISPLYLPAATNLTLGAVRQAAAVANVTAAPTAEEFNALLKSLRDAGILATE